MCLHCKPLLKTVDNLVTQCDWIIYYNHTRRHNKVVSCIHLWFCTKYGLKAFTRMGNHLVQKIVANKNVKIKIDTKVRTSIKIMQIN